MTARRAFLVAPLVYRGYTSAPSGPRSSHAGVAQLAEQLIRNQ